MERATVHEYKLAKFEPIRLMGLVVAAFFATIIFWQFFSKFFSNSASLGVQIFSGLLALGCTGFFLSWFDLGFARHTYRIKLFDNAEIGHGLLGLKRIQMGCYFFVFKDNPNEPDVIVFASSPKLEKFITLRYKELTRPEVILCWAKQWLKPLEAPLYGARIPWARFEMAKKIATSS